ncbi:MAG: DNA polymerase I, partial [Bacteroidetes bacterium RIFOXYA2_FULL_33_7]
MSKRLFLIDAYAIIFRAYYAFIKNPRINSKGENTSATFGFTNTLIDLLKKEKPTHIAVVFDPPTPTFRHEMYKEYKANRDATPEDIKKAVPYIKQIISSFNIPIIEQAGFEADDTIGTLAKKAEKEGFTVFMMTPDKDFGQLVSENIFMYKPKHSGNEAEVWGVSEVIENFRIVRPDQIIDLLALMGDASDNIPGAKGIGIKTAQKLLAQFSTVERLIENTSKLTGSVKEKIESSIENILLSKKLAIIELNVPCKIDFDSMVLEKPDFEKMQKIFEDLEFKTLISRILNFDFSSLTNESITPKVIISSPKKSNDSQGNLFAQFEPTTEEIKFKSSLNDINNISHNYYLVNTDEERKQLIKKLSELPEFCFDTESTGLNANLVDIVGISFSYKNHEAYYIPLSQNREEATRVLAEFKSIFENEKIRKIGQNLKYDMLLLKWYDINVKGELFDTMIAHYLIQPESRHNLNFLAELYLNYIPIPIEDLIGAKGKTQKNLRLIDVEKVKDYACEDADITWQLKEILEKEIAGTGIGELSEKIEMPLVHVLTSMEKEGVKINIQELNEYSKILTNDLNKLEQVIYNEAKETFNILSPKQLGIILFEKLGLDENVKKTKTKQYSTSEETLEKLKGKHPVVNLVLEYRSLNKLISTYIDALPELINPKTKKIHTSYNQAIVATGRLSSNNPNLQNIPIREEKGKEIRKSFIPSSKEHSFLSADYSQIELRLMAHLCEDKNMIEAFCHDVDFHTATAAKIHKIGIEQVTKEMRSQAKTANFGIIYGISTFGLAERLRIPRSEAKALIDGYFNSYPEVQTYIDKKIAEARRDGFVETIFKRRRY